MALFRKFIRFRTQLITELITNILVMAFSSFNHLTVLKVATGTLYTLHQINPRDDLTK